MDMYFVRRYWYSKTAIYFATGPYVDYKFTMIFFWIDVLRYELTYVLIILGVIDLYRRYPQLCASFISDVCV